MQLKKFLIRLILFALVFVSWIGRPDLQAKAEALPEYEASTYSRSWKHAEIEQAREVEAKDNRGRSYIYSSFDAAKTAGILLCSAQVRIMPLGDSITQGSASGVSDSALQISYRKDLWDRLNVARFQVNFVGSLRHGQGYAGFDADHEGHPGWRDDQIAASIYNWLVINPADVVLLHIGTNGLDSNPNDVAKILNEIDKYSENVTVVLARIINRSTYSALTTDFNDNVEAMAKTRQDNGDDILIVDMENGAGINYALLADGGDLYDNLHPYASGYTKMASVWWEALVTILPVCAEDDHYEVEEDSGKSTFNVLENDRGETLSLVSVSTSSEGGEVKLKGSTIEYTPAPDFFGVETFTYAINAGPQGSKTTATVTVSVTPVNDPPTANDDEFTVAEDSVENVLDVLANDTIAPDEDEILTIITDGAGSAGGTITTNGEVIYYTPTPDFFGIETFTYTINDGTPGSNDTASATVIVTPVNDPPEVKNPGSQSNTEEDEVSLQIEASDIEGDKLTYGAIRLPPGLAIDQNTGLISGLLSRGSDGIYQVQVTVSDGDPYTIVQVNFSWQVNRKIFYISLPISIVSPKLPDRDYLQSRGFLPGSHQ